VVNQVLTPSMRAPLCGQLGWHALVCVGTAQRIAWAWLSSACLNPAVGVLPGRLSQEMSMAHLVRHPRLQPFGEGAWLGSQLQRLCWQGI